MACFVPLDLKWMKVYSLHCIYSSTENEAIISISMPSHSGNIVAKIKKIKRWKMRRSNEQKMHMSILTAADWIVSISVAYFNWMKNNLKILHWQILQIPLFFSQTSLHLYRCHYFYRSTQANSGLALWHFLLLSEKLILWRGYTHIMYKKWKKVGFVLSWAMCYW